MSYNNFFNKLVSHAYHSSKANKFCSKVYNEKTDFYKYYALRVLFMSQRSSFSTDASDEKSKEKNSYSRVETEKVVFDANKKAMSSVDKISEEVSKKTIVSTMKDYILKRRDYTKKFTENNTITPMQAMSEYLLAPSHLEDLRIIKVRSPVSLGKKLSVYLEKDVEQKAIKVHGSLQELNNKKKALKQAKSSKKPFQRLTDLFHRKEKEEKFSALRSSSGRVVAYAAAMNGIVCMGKFICFVNTGSSSMFAESLHSLADTANQLLLFWGVNESLKKPDPEHPYGRRNMRHIMSLISGVGIFCLGSGVSVYHGIHMLISGDVAVHDVATSTSFAILGGSFILESTSLYIALNETRKNALKHNLPLLKYIKTAGDPSTNVVLLEDAASCCGLGIAASAIWLSYFTDSGIFDAIGSIAIGGLLGALATFIVATNINFLVGRSIPQGRLDLLQQQLEDDVVVRGVYDVKATMTSADEFKFKAEIDFDGMEVTRAYLSQLDREHVQREFQTAKTAEEIDQLLLQHGEQVIDELGAQVDRLEGQLKRKNPDLRHIDLEVL